MEKSQIFTPINNQYSGIELSTIYNKPTLKRKSINILFIPILLARTNEKVNRIELNYTECPPSPYPNLTLYPVPPYHIPIAPISISYRKSKPIPVSLHVHQLTIIIITSLYLRFIVISQSYNLWYRYKIKTKSISDLFESILTLRLSWG